MKFFYQDGVGVATFFFIALMAAFAIIYVVMTAFLGQPEASVYGVAAAAVLIPVVLVTLVKDRRLVRHFGTFGMNPTAARQVIAFVGTHRWKERDPRVTLEFKEWSWPDSEKGASSLDEFERKLESYKPLLGDAWPTIAMAIAYEATDRQVHYQNPDLNAYLGRLDAVLAAGTDGAVIGQAVLTFGAETGLDVAAQGIPLDYARVLYPDHISHPSTQSYMTRYART